jgi:Domain of unknown function (DUF1877)
MSQSTTLYRVSQEYFKQLDKSGINRKFNSEFAKNYSIFQGSEMGLEFILLKGSSEVEKKLIKEIFNPQKELSEEVLKNSIPEKQFELYENGISIPYLEVDKISKINNLLEKFSETKIRELYNSKELNKNGIYPQVWHNDNSENLCFNERNLTKDFSALKSIIKEAENEKDYILVFSG